MCQMMCRLVMGPKVRASAERTSDDIGRVEVNSAIVKRRDLSDPGASRQKYGRPEDRRGCRERGSGEGPMIQKLPRIGIDPGCRSIKENIRSHIRGTSTIGTRGGDLKRPRVTLTCSSHSHPRWRYTRTPSHIQPTAGRYPRTKESLVSPHAPS